MHQEPVLIELPYLPPISFFTLAVNGPLLLESQETFQKRSFRNKCLIASDQGPLMLSVPLRRGKHQSQPIQEVAIAYDDSWQQQHIRAIDNCYRSAPYFDHFFPAWEQLLASNHSKLWELNWNALELAVNQLDLPVQIAMTLEYESPTHWQDYRNAIHPRNYQEMECPTYTQVFADRTGFLTNLCILDLIFCCGPEGRLKLQSPF